MGEQLGAEADAEHGDPAVDRLAQQRRLGAEHRIAVDVEHRLLAAERQQAVDLVERGQRLAVAQAPLVELDAGRADGVPGVAR